MTRPTARSVVVGGLRTSVSVEREFWAGLREISKEDGVPIQQILTNIARRSSTKNLSAEIRLFVYRRLRKTLLSLEDQGRQ